MSFLYSTSLQDIRGQGKKNWEATPTASHWCHQKRSKTEKSLPVACLLLPTPNLLLPSLSYNQPFTITYKFETAVSGGTPGSQTLLFKKVKTSSLCVSSPPVQQAAICPQAVGGQQKADCSRPHARPPPASERCAPHGRNKSLPSPPGHHRLQIKKGKRELIQVKKHLQKLEVLKCLQALSDHKKKKSLSLSFSRHSHCPRHALAWIYQHFLLLLNGPKWEVDCSATILYNRYCVRTHTHMHALRWAQTHKCMHKSIHTHTIRLWVMDLFNL